MKNRKRCPLMDKYVFQSELPPTATILDVGCGNDSPYWTKQILPNSYYVGVDIENYAFERKEFADEYYLTTSLDFADTVHQLGKKEKSSTHSEYGMFDAVICAHNLEHVHDRKATLIAMCSALKKGGRIFLSFPSSMTRFYPSRAGSLNYYDDPTHTGRPPNFIETKQILLQNGVEITFARKNYRDNEKIWAGIRNEWKSHRKKVVEEGTWSLWGFETIIWGERR